MRMMRNLLIAAGALLFALQANAADVVGKWRTIDDESGKPKSIVEIFERGGKYHGRVVELLPGATIDTCEKCKGPLAGKPIVGMQVVTGMVKKGDMYEGGTLLDPKSGKTYDGKMWAEGNTLKVRGYLGFFYRTQTWYKVD